MQTLVNARGDQFELPLGLAVHGFNRLFRVPTVETRSGVVITGKPTTRATTGAIRGTIVTPTRADAAAWLDNFLAFLHATPLHLHQTDTASRFLEVFVQSIDDASTVVARSVSINVALVAPDPLWHGVADTHTEVIDPFSTSFVINVGGSAVTHPTISIEGGGSGNTAPTKIALSNTTTGRTVTYNPALPNGYTLELDSAKRIARIGNAGVLNDIEPDFLIHGFPLAPGVNTLNLLRASGSAPVTVQIDWVERWL